MVTKKTMVIQGMNDQSDADKVSQALHEIWGINKVNVSLNRGEVTFSYDELSASLNDFEEAVLELGFEIETGDQIVESSLHDWHTENSAGGNGNAKRL